MIDLSTRCLIEGRENRNILSVFQPSTSLQDDLTQISVNGISGAFSTSQDVQGGRAYLYESITVSASVDGFVRIVMGESTHNNEQQTGGFNSAYISNEMIVLVGAFNPTTIPFNKWMLENTRTSIYFTPKSANPNTDKYYFNASPNIKNLTNDFNWGAEKTMLVVGDSISEGAVAVDYSSVDLYAFKLRNNLINDGIDVRLVNKAISGLTTTNINTLLEKGFYEVKSDLIIYMAGANDVSGGLTTQKQTDFVSNIGSFVSHQRRNNKKALILILGITPLQDANKEDDAQILRILASSFVSTLNDNRVKYIEMSDCFDSLDDLNYRDSERGTNTAVHPSPLGHYKISQRVHQYIQDNNLTF